MKRSQKNIREKRSRNDEDSFDRKKRRAKKFSKNMKGKKDFSNQYEHELYIDNYEY